jgi:hypothetical protein
MKHLIHEEDHGIIVVVPNAVCLTVTNAARKKNAANPSAAGLTRKQQGE